MSDVSFISISFVPPYPEYGIASALLRCRGEDLAVIKKAAQVLGLRDSQFLRIAAIRSAERVLQEFGIDLETVKATESEHIDLTRGDKLNEHD